MRPENVKSMLFSMGMHVSDEKLYQIVSRADGDRDGAISLEEFMSAYEWFLNQDQTEEDLMKVFSVLDADKSGTIELNELVGIMSSTKRRLSEEEARDILLAADTDMDGVIDWHEFKTLMRENKATGWKLLTTFRVIFVIGGPASGKGTLSTLLVEMMKGMVVHVSSGDLLRLEVRSGSKLGMEVDGIMKRGELVSAEIVIALLEKFIYNHPGKLLLLDGFPRSIENAKDFYKLFGPGEGILCFNCPDDVMALRIVERGKISGRADDNEETAWQRIKTFHAQSQGPLKYLITQHCPLYEFDTTVPIQSNLERLLKLPMFASYQKQIFR